MPIGDYNYLQCNTDTFFSESEILFQISQSPHKKYSKTLSWAWNLNKLFTDMGGNFKLRIVFFWIFFWEIGRFEKWFSLSEKRHLYICISLPLGLILLKGEEHNCNIAVFSQKKHMLRDLYFNKKNKNKHQWVSCRIRIT